MTEHPAHITVFRAATPCEIEQLESAGWRAWPAPDQDLPAHLVLNEERALIIARDWLVSRPETGYGPWSPGFSQRLR